MSMVAAIFNDAAPLLLPSLTEAQHAQCAEYLCALLEIRDREEITRVLCRSNPDLFSQALREVVAAFDSTIRVVHRNVDLREHVSAAEGFIGDFIKTNAPKKRPNGSTAGATGDQKSDWTGNAPSIEDYVSLFRRNRHLLYNWLHQIASQCPEIREDFRAWAKQAVRTFRQSRRPTSSDAPKASPPEDGKPPGIDTQRKGAAGALSSNLQTLFVSLPPETRGRIAKTLDAHTAYLISLETLSLNRMQHILDDMPEGGVLASPTDEDTSSSTICGPGMFISRWQQLLDETIITPATPTGGPLRRGKDIKGSLAQGKTVISAAAKDGWDASELARFVEKDVPSPPDVGIVVEALGGKFRRLVVDLLKREMVGGGVP